jgi:hypothetical protein
MTQITGSDFMNAWSFFCRSKGYIWRKGFDYYRSNNSARSRARMRFYGMDTQKGTVQVQYYNQKADLVKTVETPISEIMKFFREDQRLTRRKTG